VLRNTVLSLDAEAMSVPSGVYETPHTAAVCPTKAPASLPSTMSQTRIVPSMDPEAANLQYENTENTRHQHQAEPPEGHKQAKYVEIKAKYKKTETVGMGPSSSERSPPSGLGFRV
jgi:hypothetical protein